MARQLHFRPTVNISFATNKSLVKQPTARLTNSSSDALRDYTAEMRSLLCVGDGRAGDDGAGDLEVLA
jgi:hypothetical protein